MLDQTRCLSGPVPAVAAIHSRCNQVMSSKWLAPSRVAPHPVFNGHDLEIPTVLWGVTHAKGTSLGSIALIPMGGRCGADPNPKHESKGLRRSEWQLVRQTLQRIEEVPSSCASCVDLTGAFS